MLVVLFAIPPHIIASDTDAPPFLIYVDPVTGKYTKKKPEHETSPQQTETISSASNIPAPDPPPTRLAPAFLMAGGLLLSSYVLSRVIANLRA